MLKRFPTLDLEQSLLRAGHTCIAGLDEAGRGAWAGPVSAAAVILPLGNPSLLEKLNGVRDSKLCTPRQRAMLYDKICRVAVSWGVSLVPALRIDEIGIAPATRQAMREAISQLNTPPDALLIDYIKLPTIGLTQLSIKKGDQKSLTIAAASILAKVTRDRQLVVLDKIYTDYGFAQHKGYGTKQHQAALLRLGPSEIHRRSFAPIAASIHTHAIDKADSGNVKAVQTRPSARSKSRLQSHLPTSDPTSVDITHKEHKQ